MATRLYFPSSGTPPLPSQAISPLCDYPVSGDPEYARLPCYVDKQNTSLTTIGGTWPSSASSYRWCIAQYQTPPLASAYSFTTGDSGQYVFGKAFENSAAVDTTFNVRGWVISGDGSVNRGQFFVASSSEFPTTAATRIGTDSALTAVAAQAGDRLLFEVHTVGVTPATEAFSFRIGDPSGTSDFAHTDGLTTDLCGWIELSPTLSFSAGSTSLTLTDSSQSQQSDTASFIALEFNNSSQSQASDEQLVLSRGHATTHVKIDFSNDNGVAESFQPYSAVNWSSPVFDGAEGNPSGSLYTNLSNYTFESSSYYIEKSLENWGVPAGATIIDLGNLSADYKADLSGGAHDCWPGISLQRFHAFYAIIEYLYPSSSFDSSVGWTAAPLQETYDQSPYASTHGIGIVLDCYGYAPTVGEIKLWYDNIRFDIEYNTSKQLTLVDSSQSQPSDNATLTVRQLVGSEQSQTSDTATLTQHNSLSENDSAQSQASGIIVVWLVHLVGGITQAKHTVTGGMSIGDVMALYGAVTQKKHKPTGILYIPLSDSVEQQETTSIKYELKIDGVEYSMIRALVERHADSEKARVTIPSKFMPEIIAAAPSALLINSYSILTDGSSSGAVELFNGIIDMTAAKILREQGVLVANNASAYPTRVNRYLSGEPMYMRESGSSSAVRGAIDPLVVPGDVINYGDTRMMIISKVIFNIDREYSFMEINNG